MKKVSQSSSSGDVARPLATRPVRRFRPKFGPDPAPQPIFGRLGPSVSMVRRRRSVERRVGQGAAAPLRFVFVRRLQGRSKTRPSAATRKPSTSPRIRKASARNAVTLRESSAILSTKLPESNAGLPESAGMPWVQQLMAAHLEPDAIPQGLPEIPSILLEDDGEADDASSFILGLPNSFVGMQPSAVWLAGCDPRTLLLGWEEAGGPATELASPTEWRLRSVDEPESILAAGTLPTDRRFLFLQDPPPAPAHIVEIGARSPHGDWECLASSGPVSLPPSAYASDTSRSQFLSRSQSLNTGESGIKPGVSPDYFSQIIDSSSMSIAAHGSSELGVRMTSGRSGSGGLENPSSSSDLALGVSSGEWPSSSVCLPSVGGEGAPEDFWFRVNAEVVVFGSAKPGAQVTLSGRPIALRPDGSFTFRCALPDGRFELPLVAVAPRGSEVRHATLTLARQTVVQGGVGSHPGTPGLPPLDAIP